MYTRVNNEAATLNVKNVWGGGFSLSLNYPDFVILNEAQCTQASLSVQKDEKYGYRGMHGMYGMYGMYPSVNVNSAK
jgi:hypothetical protein